MVGHDDIFDIMLVFFPFVELLIEGFEFRNQLYKMRDLGQPAHFQLEGAETNI